MAKIPEKVWDKLANLVMHYPVTTDQVLELYEASMDLSVVEQAVKRIDTSKAYEKILKQIKQR